MSDRVIKYKLFGLWEYEREEKMLNEASENGLQLVKNSRFRAVFRRDNSVRYYYQLDYNRSIIDPIRYRETFEEQGWEYVNSTYNGWHYFRKLRNSDSDEHDYRIYTDKQSLYEMQNRWLRFGLIIGILTALMASFYVYLSIKEDNWFLMINCFAFMIFSFMFISAYCSIMSRRKGKHGNFLIPLKVMAPLIILLTLTNLSITFIVSENAIVHHENFSIICTEESQLPSTCGNYSINESGYYRLSLSAEILNGEMFIEIKDSYGKTVFDNLVENSGKVGNSDIYLKAGIYQTFYSYSLGDRFDYSGTNINLDLKIMKTR